MMFENDLFEHLNIELTPYQKDQFKHYFTLLVDYNRNVNLTRITEELEVYYKHFFDSLTLTNVLNFNTVKSICDMGAGAGFPSIPLKIVYPHLKVTIVDSLKKRITFLHELCKTIGIDDVKLIHNRAEVHAVMHQEVYDVVTARALGHLGLISEMGIPMLKVKGYFIAPKGSHCMLEINQAKDSISKLGGQITQVHEFSLPHDYGQRTNILITKIKHVSGFPRPFAQMSKNLL